MVLFYRNYSSERRRTSQTSLYPLPLQIRFVCLSFKFQVMGMARGHLVTSSSRLLCPISPCHGVRLKVSCFASDLHSLCSAVTHREGKSYTAVHQEQWNGHRHQTRVHSCLPCIGLDWLICSFYYTNWPDSILGAFRERDFRKLEGSTLTKWGVHFQLVWFKLWEKQVYTQPGR